MRKKGPSWSISGRSRPLSKQPTPGPGAYTPITSQQNLKFSVGKAQRKNLVQISPDLPGPGTYTLSLPYSRGSLIGSGKRSNFRVSQTPGPGTYNPSARTASPSYSLRSRLRFRRKSYFPGPGQYNPRSETGWERLPTAVIGKERRLQRKVKDFPGPGTYQEVKSIRGPRWQFGSAKRTYKVKSWSPGPAAYQVD